MITIPIYQIDAFTSTLFGGNPAALMPLSAWLDDAKLQAIAAENNLSETAFLVEHTPTHYALRWFTPTKEVELCGHATLATAWWLFQQASLRGQILCFDTRSGELTAHWTEDGVEINLPLRPSETDEALRPIVESALGSAPIELRRGANAVAIFATEKDVADLQPDFTRLRDLHPLGLIVTAPGNHCDFVSRYFAPSYGIDEDPVTGSAHADLMPYWVEKLGKTELQAQQISARGGVLALRQQGERVYMRGHCVQYLSGCVTLDA